MYAFFHKKSVPPFPGAERNSVLDHRTRVPRHQKILCILARKLQMQPHLLAGSGAIMRVQTLKNPLVFRKALLGPIPRTLRQKADALLLILDPPDAGEDHPVTMYPKQGAMKLVIQFEIARKVALPHGLAHLPEQAVQPFDLLGDKRFGQPGNHQPSSAWRVS